MNRVKKTPSDMMIFGSEMTYFEAIIVYRVDRVRSQSYVDKNKDGFIAETPLRRMRLVGPR